VKAKSSTGKGRETFRDYVAGVRPLEARSRRVPPPARKGLAARSALEGAPIFDVRREEERVSGARRGFEDTLADLEVGRHPLHASLDLHGLHADDARKALLAFVRTARGRVPRAILVVHGKGRHSPGGRGILRDEIADWLSTPPLAEHVLCFVTAKVKDGGAGAVYALVAPWR
jgi:DNA-nicking Smr family endonuclease